MIDDDYHHLLTFKDIKDENGTVVKKAMDDVKALFSLFAMAILANVFDKRTYMPFVNSVNDPSPQELQEQKVSDTNAIPFLERRHYAYTRGLAFNLISWFLNRFSFSKGADDPDNEYGNLAVPFTADVANYMVQYKFEAHECDVPGACSLDDFIEQVHMALFGYEDMGDAFQVMEDDNPSFAFDLSEFTLKAFDTTQANWEPITDFFDFGQTQADRRYFSALDDQR